MRQNQRPKTAPSATEPHRPVAFAASRARHAAAGLMLACATLLAAPGMAQAQTNVPANWELIPRGLGPGDSFRLLLVTSTTRDATATDIAVYDAHVQGAVSSKGHPRIRQYSDSFRVLGSTQGLGARSHTGMTGTGVPVYWLNGARAADDYDNFFDESQWGGSARFESGRGIGACCRKVFTGTTRTGEAHGTGYLGASSVRFGYADGTDPRLNQTITADSEVSLSFYGMSPVFLVAASEEPAVTGVRFSSTPPYHTDDHIRVALTFDQPVAVDTTGGVPSLALEIGVQTRAAAYESGSGTGELVFAYRVAASDRDDDGIAIGMAALNGGAIHLPGDPGVAADLGDPSRTPSAHQRVNVAPYVRSVTVPSRPRAAPDTYALGETITFRVTFSEAVEVTGEPHFEFELGEARAVARLTGGSGTAELLFGYEVVSGDLDEDGVWIGDQSRTLKLDPGEQIRGARTGRDAVLDHAAPGTKGQHKVDADASPGDLSSDATLKSLSLGIALTPGFAPETTRYTALVRNQITQGTLTVARNDPGARHRITPGDADRGTSGHQIDFAEGETAVEVRVTAEDGVTTRTYTVVVTRAAPVAPVATSAQLWASTLTTSTSTQVAPGYRDSYFVPLSVSVAEGAARRGSLTDTSFVFRNRTFSIDLLLGYSGRLELILDKEHDDLKALTLHVGTKNTGIA